MIGVTMLMVACGRASAELVEYLIDMGADVNAADNLGQSPLDCAAGSKQDTIRKIDLLLDAGVNVNRLGDDGSTALSVAAFSQNAEAVKHLIDRGAEVGNRDKQGYTALSWACGKCAPRPEVMEVLLREGADAEDLYAMDCVVQYFDYEESRPFGMPSTVMLRADQIKERYLYEHALVPMMLTNFGRQNLEEEGFYF